MKLSNITYTKNRETYQIYGGEVVSINLLDGDSIEIIDTEGDQQCSVLAFDNKGYSAMNSLKSSTKSTLNKFNLSPKNLSNATNDILKKHKLNTDNLTSIKLFKKNSLANSSRKFKVKRDTLCVFEAESSEMFIDKQNTPTEILINVSRLNPKKPSDCLPRALSKTISDFRIKNSTATSYIVKAGQYIQIIDVEGHQCSDFQAFLTSDLKNNIITNIEPTVTRSYMGLSCSEPGVYNKFYNQNSVALVEIVQDTVCRHDTFCLACNAKYYEDRGFPGHISCTDNFNYALKEHSITSRKTWVTVNLFFNTAIEECHSLSSDVSWSRPGDYVLFRALTDLVCVSSACPDDTSPANNWNPTDIHVRIYDSSNDFPFATAFRPDPKTTPTMTKKTSFYDNTQKLTKNYSNYNGYWLPLEYNNLGALKEYWQCRESVVIIDLSPLRKFEIYGPDAEVLMQYAITRDVRKLAVRKIVYSAICYDNGCMLDDGTLFRLDNDNFRWICGSDDCGKFLRKIASEKNFNVWIKSSTDQLHNVAVQGPNSRKTLAKIIWTPNTQTPLLELKWFNFTIGRIGGENGIPVVVSRTGYSGELGYEVFAHPKDCTKVWDMIMEAGNEFGIAPLGLNALDMLRIEAGLVFANYEFCDQTDPFEAGIGFTVPIDTKDEDFSGKKALIARNNSPQRTLVGLELSGNEVAEHGNGVYVGKQQVGIITSATRSPILKKNIALCRISVDSADIGKVVEVGKLDGHHKRIVAKVVTFPFYDPEKTRVRM